VLERDIAAIALQKLVYFFITPQCLAEHYRELREK